MAVVAGAGVAATDDEPSAGRSNVACLVVGSNPEESGSSRVAGWTPEDIEWFSFFPDSDLGLIRIRVSSATNLPNFINLLRMLNSVFGNSVRLSACLTACLSVCLCQKTMKYFQVTIYQSIFVHRTHEPSSLHSQPRVQMYLESAGDLRHLTFWVGCAQKVGAIALLGLNKSLAGTAKTHFMLSKMSSYCHQPPVPQKDSRRHY